MKDFSIKSTIGVIFLYIFSNIFLSVMYSLMPIENKILDNIVLSLISVLLLVIVLLMSRKNLNGQFGDFIKNFKTYIPSILKYWLVGFALMIIANYVINYLILDGLAPNESANREILKMYPFYSLVHMCFLGPFTEELLFRLNFKVIKNRLSYLLFSSISFGLMHVVFSSTSLSDLLYIVPYTILGVAFGLIFYKTKNVYASTLAHALHNTLSVVIILLGI